MYEDYTSLDRADREWLTELARRRQTWSVGRPLPNALNTLIRQGLAFRAHTAISITDKGRDVLERVA